MQSPSTASATLTPAETSGSGLQILIMAVAAFIIVTTEFLIVGLLPALSRDLNISIALAGQVVTLFAFTVMLFGPVLTARLAHVERKKLFTLILMVFAASNVLAAVSTNIWIMALARFIPALALPVFWGQPVKPQGNSQGLVNRARPWDGFIWALRRRWYSGCRWALWRPTRWAGAEVSGFWRRSRFSSVCSCTW